MLRRASAAVLLALAGCTPAEQQQALAAASTIAALCSEAMPLVPLAGPAAPWIIGGCATDQAIVTLARDPTSAAWLQGMIARIQQR